MANLEEIKRKYLPGMVVRCASNPTRHTYEIKKDDKIKVTAFGTCYIEVNGLILHRTTETTGGSELYAEIVHKPSNLKLYKLL